MPIELKLALYLFFNYIALVIIVSYFLDIIYNSPSILGLSLGVIKKGTVL